MKKANQSITKEGRFTNVRFFQMLHITPTGSPTLPGKPLPGMQFTGRPLTGKPFTGMNHLPENHYPEKPFTGKLFLYFSPFSLTSFQPFYGHSG